MSRTVIALAAGGTGGHMFPAEALARALIGRGLKVAMVTDGRGGEFGESGLDIEMFRIRAATVGAGLIGKLKTALAIAIGYFQARGILKRLKPAALVGFGGYASAPTVLAAGACRVPVLLHEQNAILGRTNRLLAGRAAGIAVAFPSVGGTGKAGEGKLVRTGNPVRPAIVERAATPYDPPAAPPAAPPSDDRAIRILVLGGSQGARALSELVPGALAKLEQPVRRRLVVTQQCRAEDLEMARAAYEGTHIDHQLDTFFQDVPRLMAEAHLVICRSGASTIAELTAIGRPSILIPYPFAADDHQTANAAALEAAGGGWLMPQGALSVDSLSERVATLIGSPDVLSRAAAAAKDFGTTDAAGHLADAVMRLAGIDRRDGGGDSHPRQEVAA